ncbi:MAG: S-methyl-5-thioribose-1-phosphate isomerase [Nitrososphaeria archaeon]
MNHIEWTGEGLKIIDQRRLPGQVKHLYLRSLEDCFRSIVQMQVRGAPLIGIVGAFGLALFARDLKARSKEEFLEKIKSAAKYISNARPTAYNLEYCVQLVSKAVQSQKDIDSMKYEATRKAIEIMNAEEEYSRRIGENGEPLLEDGDTILTHCNAGELATIKYGTALAPIRVAAEKGKCIYVIATETRPAQQGARLTAWELAQNKIPVTVVADTAVGYLMEKRMVNKVIVGADRITADGYVFNKIGTYQIAVLAWEHKIPFYVAAPTSTFDPHLTREAIVIEERGAKEIAEVGRKRIVPKGVRVYNPVFDRTPPTLIRSIISEKGVLYPPFDKSISRMAGNRT